MNAYIMEVLVNIIECYMPIFKLISSIKVFPEEYGNYDTTRKYIIDTIEDVVRNSEKISDFIVKLIYYLDNIILSVYSAWDFG